MKKILMMLASCYLVSCGVTAVPVIENKPAPVKKIYRLSGTNKDGKKIIFDKFK